jgi:hypothetical protein
METVTSLLAILLGLLLRLAIPLLGTLILIYFLRKLDAHWQAEAQPALETAEKIECWKVKGCSEEQRNRCAAASSSLPCWQVYRQPNGYLQEKCLTCEVFTKAPLPTLRIEPRRM